MMCDVVRQTFKRQLSKTREIVYELTKTRIISNISYSKT